MAEIQAQAKKTTVRNLATEINISHDTLIEFLQKKGFSDVKSIMSKVGEDALEQGDLPAEGDEGHLRREHPVHGAELLREMAGRRRAHCMVPHRCRRHR